MAGDIRQRGPARPPDPAFYVSLRQQPDPPIFVFVRSALDAAGTNAAIRAALSAADHRKLALVHTMATLADRSADVTRRERFNAATTTAVGALAVLLVVAGVYANLSYAVTQRRKEIALRLALGESSRRMQRRIVRGAIRHGRRRRGGRVAGRLAGLEMADINRHRGRRH